jgi:hypothetical protein
MMVDDVIATSERRSPRVVTVEAAHERPTPAAASHAMEHAVRRHLERSDAEIESVLAREVADVSVRGRLHPHVAVTVLALGAPRTLTVMYPAAGEVLAVAVPGSAKTVVTASGMIVDLASVMIAVIVREATGLETMTAGTVVETAVVDV